MLASGRTATDVANEMGISRQSISRIREEKKAVIERESARLLRSLPDAVGIQVKLIESFDKVDSIADPSRFRAVVNASDNLLKSTGIHASQAPAIHIQSLYQDNRGAVISPLVLQLLGKAIQAPSIIEAESLQVVEAVGETIDTVLCKEEIIE